LLLRGIGALHRAGIVHRDVKPTNVILTRHVGPVLVDLGFAHLGERSPHLTPHGRVVGTPGFIPPELLLGTSPVTPAADVYATGVLLYQMLSGALPFYGSVPETVQKIVAGPRPNLATSGSVAPSAVVAVVHRALSRDLGERYVDADAMAAGLTEASERSGLRAP
jgi:serine/threonine-protein kinase